MESPTKIVSGSAKSAPEKLRLEKFADQEITCLRVIGGIDESFEGKKHAAGIKTPVVVLEMSGVDRVTSFGIREWSNFISVVNKSARETYLIGCSPKVVNQINMVSSFVGSGLVFSFYASYFCDNCEKSNLVLINVDRDYESIKKHQAPAHHCATCGGEQSLEEDPAAYFSYVAQQKQFVLDQKIASFLVSRLDYAVSDLARRIHAEKTVGDSATFLKLSGNIDSSLPSRKLAEGMEGSVILDLGSVGGIDPPGAAEFRKFLALLNLSCQRVFMIGCPPILLERATQPEDLGKNTQILSFSMPYNCPACSVTTAREIDVEEHYGVLKVGMPPTVTCGECKGTTRCTASGTLLSYLPNLAKPEVDAGLRKFIKSARKAKPKKKAANDEPNATSATVHPALLVGSAALVAVVLGYGYFQQRQTEESLKQTVAQLGATAQRSRPAWITSDTPSSGYCTDLSNRTVCVGVSSFSADKNAARGEARDTALESLAHAVGLKVEGEVFSKSVRRPYVEARQRAMMNLEASILEGDQSAADAARAHIRSVRRVSADLLRQTGGPGVPTQIADWYWEEYEAKAGGSEYLVFVRFDVSVDAMRALSAQYSTPLQAGGADFLPDFPESAWLSQARGRGLVLAGTSKRWSAAGVQPGDAITGIEGRSLSNPMEMAETIEKLPKSANLQVHSPNGTLRQVGFASAEMQ